MKTPTVGLGDFVTAAAALRPQGRAREALAAMCGLRLAQPGSPEPGLRDDEAIDLEEDWDDEPDEGNAPAGPVVTVPPGVRRLTPARVHAPEVPVVEDPLGLARALPRQAPTRFAGLLDARDTTDVLTSAASSLGRTGELDVERAVEALARAESLRELPRLRRPSFGLGVQVLVDVGSSMEPFLEDQQHLLESLGEIMREGVAVQYFDGDPLRGGGDRRRRSLWAPYRSPRIGTPVLALSDLGCGFPSQLRTPAWLALARRLARRRSRLIVFAPVRAARIPPPLKRCAVIVVWDRSGGRRTAARLLRALDA